MRAVICGANGAMGRLIREILGSDVVGCVSIDGENGVPRTFDELGRVVIPKEIRRTLRIREGDPSQITGKAWEKFCFAMNDLAKRAGW